MIREFCSRVYRWWNPLYEIYEVQTGRVMATNMSRLEAINECSEWNEVAMLNGWLSVYRWRVEQ